MKFLPTPAASKKSILRLHFEQNDFWAKYLPTDPLTASWLMSDHFAVDFSEKIHFEVSKSSKNEISPHPGSIEKIHFEAILSKMIFELNTYRQILLLPPDSCLITSLLISVKKGMVSKSSKYEISPHPGSIEKIHFEQNDFWAKYLPTDPLTASWLMSDHFAVDFSEKKAWFQKAPKMKFLPTPAASKKSILGLFWAKWFLS